MPSSRIRSCTSTHNRKVLETVSSTTLNLRSNVLQYPESGNPVSAHVRKWVLSRFPYNLLYVVEGDGILVVAVAPHKRRPNYWRKRLHVIRKKADRDR